MNEPSVFSGDELTLPKNAIHLTSDYEFYMHKDVHNANGILGARASFKGALEREESKNIRPFLLSRSVFFGSQKYGAMWTGDNQAHPHFLGLSVSMCLSLAVSGVPFCGSDVGGNSTYFI
jgi:alpha 1,3-glucosidase